jgi:hypothetical protein
VDEPLLPVDGALIELDETTQLPPDLADHDPRPALDGDPLAHLTAVLFADLEARLATAIEAGTDDVVGLVLPELLHGPQGEACRQAASDTIAQADAVIFTQVPGGPDTSVGAPIFQAAAEVQYPTGSVALVVLAVPGPGGRLFMALPECLPAV